MMKFANLTDNQINFIESIYLDDMFISMGEIYDIRENLNLYGMGESELRAMRNAVVRHLSEKFDKLENDFKAGKKLLTNMSGITCVIDDMLVHIGCEV